MKRSLALLGVLLAALLAVVALDRHQEQSPVYTVQALQLSLPHVPGRWVGRTAWVRGTLQDSGCLSLDAGGSAPCRDRSAYLLDRDGASVLPVAGWEPNPLLAVLRRLPMVGGFVPGPQVVRWGVLATYRVVLQAAPAAVCDATPCYQALLLDAAS